MKSTSTALPPIHSLLGPGTGPGLLRLQKVCIACKTLTIAYVPSQVTVSVHVEASRKLCSQVAKGEVDAALIGGEVPIEIRHVLRVSHLCRLMMPTSMLILLPPGRP